MKTIKGYNENKFVTVEHVFIPYENKIDGKYGCFFFSKEIAISQSEKQNGVNMEIDSIVVDGIDLFQANYTNCFN